MMPRTVDAALVIPGNRKWSRWAKYIMLADDDSGAPVLIDVQV